MRKVGAMIMALAMLPIAAMAQPVDGKTARKMLFSPRGADLILLEDSGLDPAQAAVLQAILDGLKGSDFENYYGAVAVSPTFFSQLSTQGEAAVLSGLFQLATAFHTPQAAATAAMVACEAARGEADAQCVVAAGIAPRKWSQQPVSLSVLATESFKSYRKGSGPKAVAVSAGTTAYAIAKGDGAATQALARCNAEAAKTGSPDCEIVIAD